MYSPARQISFGSYLFPITAQETSRVTTLAFDKKKVPFNYGESVSLNSSLSARDIVITCAVGSLIQGSNDNILATNADLENERRLLAGLQLNGRQALQVGEQQFIYCFLESFEHKFFADAFGFRYADWTLKFYCDDPRYISTTPSNHSGGASGSFIPVISGNVRSYPSCVFSGSGSAPFINIASTSGTQLSVTFSKLTMNGTLSIVCDPRTNNRSQCAVYNGTNALAYAAITDFHNDYDLTEWFPFFNPPQIETGMTFSWGFASGGTGTFLCEWADLWI